MEFRHDFASLQADTNLDELMTREQSEWIGRHVVDGYCQDKAGRAEWEKKNKEAMELALQVAARKTTPWDGASNVKFPLLTVATLQFAARAYSALVRTPEPVRCRVIGDDPAGQKRARASRVAAHMSWQILEQDESWEEEHDRALMVLPIIGTTFKKTWRDGNVTRSVHVLAEDLVLDYYARSVEECERKTHVLPPMPIREIREKQLSGFFSDVTLTSPAMPEQMDAAARKGISPPSVGAGSPRVLLEQHCWMDFDGDGLPEPYAITVDRDSAQVLRIANRFGKVHSRQSMRIEALQKSLAENPDPAFFSRVNDEILRLHNEPPELVRIEAVEYFTKYGFIPSPDGSIYDLGFGQLMSPINESVNSLINQLIDSGSLQNGSSGFIGRGARLPGGEVRFRPFEWKKVDVAGAVLRDSIVPLPVNPPSPVLFQLLGLMINYGERIASVNEAMLGQNPGQNTPAYNQQQMLQQGMQVFSGIFKRLYRSQRNEFRKWYRLNAIYLSADEYFQVLDGPERRVFIADYRGDPTDIVPAADPNAILSEEKMRQAAILAERSRMVPGYNPIAVEQRLLEAMSVQDIQQVFPTDPNTGAPMIPPPQNPEVEFKREEERRRVLEARDRAQQNAVKLRIDALNAEASIELLQAQTIKTLAEAGAIDQKLANDRAKLALERMEIQRQAAKDILDAEVKRSSSDAVAGKPGGGSPAQDD